MDTIVKLKIADILIHLHSEFALAYSKENGENNPHIERYRNFLYRGEEKAHIIIEIKIADTLPDFLATEDIFTCYHPEGHSENWQLKKMDDFYIFKNLQENNKQCMLVNGSFDRVDAHLLPHKREGMVWNFSDIIYDFLQVLLINYLALNNQGIFTHSIGVKDRDGRGLLFAGDSGAGKSTTARIWHKYSDAIVLNDDRIIVRRLNDKFFIHGSPWHGDFSDYLESQTESAVLDKLFFIYHAPKNTIQRISKKEAFNLLYPALFPPFWDKVYLENVVSFCQDLVMNAPCFRFGFLDNEEIVEFIRKI